MSGAVGYYYKNRTPYSENYFLAFERQAGANTVLTVSYIGSEGHHLITLLSANPGNPTLCLSVRPAQRSGAGITDLWAIRREWRVHHEERHSN